MRCLKVPFHLKCWMFSNCLTYFNINVQESVKSDIVHDLTTEQNVYVLHNFGDRLNPYNTDVQETLSGDTRRTSECPNSENIRKNIAGIKCVVAFFACIKLKKKYRLFNVQFQLLIAMISNMQLLLKNINLRSRSLLTLKLSINV